MRVQTLELEFMFLCSCPSLLSAKWRSRKMATCKPGSPVLHSRVSRIIRNTRLLCKQLGHMLYLCSSDWLGHPTNKEEIESWEWPSDLAKVWSPHSHTRAQGTWLLCCAWRTPQSLPWPASPSTSAESPDPTWSPVTLSFFFYFCSCLKPEWSFTDLLS